MSKNLSKKVVIYIDGKPAEASIQQLYKEISRLRNEQSKLPIGTQEYIEKSRELARLNAIYKDQKSAVNDLGNSWKSATDKLASLSNIIMGIQSIFQMADAGIGKLKDLVADAAELDDAYADVMKTTGLTRDEVLKLNESFKKMDTRTAREQLNQLAYEAGKLGISSQQQVEQFVRAADKINIALGDVLGDGAMVTIGKLTQIFEASTTALEGKNLEEKMLAIGSAVNSLGQASTANEGYMVEFMKRLGGIAAQAGLSADQILGYASALDQNGQAVEMSATAFTKMIMQMVKKPEEFVKAAGVSIEEFRRMMDEDMNGTIMRVLEGMDAQGGFQQIVKMFNEMGLDGSRAAQAISSLAKHLDQVREAQSLASKEIETGNSVINEFTTKNNTMQAQAEKAKKAFQDMRLELGEQLYPVVIHLTRLSTSVIKGLSGYLTLWRENRAAAAALTTATVTLVAWFTRHRIATLASNAATAIKNKLDDLARISTLRKAAATAKANAAIEAERLANLKAELAETKKIATMKVEASDYSALTLKTMAQGRAVKLETAIIEQETIATEASTAATEAKSAALRAIPWGLIIAGLTTAAYVLAKFIKHQNRFNRETRETNKAIASQSSEANYLFSKLERLNSSSEEYRETLEKLNQLYPDILAKYTDEEGHLLNIAAARQEVIDKIREQIVEQRKLDKISDIAGTFGEKQTKYLQRLKKTLHSQSLFEDVSQLLPKDYNARVDYWDVLGKVKELTTGRTDINWGALNRQVKGYVDAVNEAYDETKEFNELYVGLGGKEGTDKDPFKLQGKSLEQLNAELKTAQQRLQAFERAVAQGREGFQAKIDNETARIHAIQQAINSIPSTQPTPSSQPAPSTDPAQAEKDIKKWEQVKEQAERLISDFNAKAQTGLSKTLAEIENRSASLRRDIEESVGATRQQKDALIAQINEAEAAYKQAKIDEYIKKLNTEAEKFAKSDTSNEKLNQVRDAAARLAQQLAEIDNQINAISDDLQRKDITDSQRQQLEALIQQYAAAKQQLSASAFRGIDTAVDTSSFSLSGDIDKDTKEYERLTKQIENARQATEELSNLAKDPAQRQEYELQTLALIEQQRTLDEIYAGAEQFADRMRRSNFLDKLADKLQTFGDLALGILGNIFQIVDNIGQKELNEAKNQKEENEKLLEKQLENGIISQEEYEKKINALQDEYDEKEKEVQLEQWKRQKALNLSEATMQGAIAVLKALASAPPPENKILAGISAALAASQIAAIASEPEPYARGGFVRDKKIMVGEAGSEWIASHRLLTDPVTAPVIAALDNYQRLPSMAAVNMPAVRQVSQQRNDSARINAALLVEVQRLAAYLSDPDNRRAVISRRTQETFDANENFLRSIARL